MRPNPFYLSALALIMFLPILPGQAGLVTEHGLPGSIPGTEVWIVDLTERPFNLHELRQAFMDGQSASEIETIIQGLAEKAELHQQPLAELATRLGGRMVSQWWLVNCCAIEVPFNQLDRVRAHHLVNRIYPDQIRKPGGAPIKSSTNELNHSADLPQGTGIRGKGVTIAIPDTGFDIAYKGTAPPYKPNPTFYVNGNQSNTTGGGINGSRILVARKMTTYAIDQVDGHGTHVAGVAAGEKWATTSLKADQGQAPGSSLALYCWAIDQLGGTTLATMVNTWQQIVTDKKKYNIQVANNSFMGSAPPTWVEQQAMDSAVLNADIFIAAMCGNFGSNNHYSNGATNILCVGSVDPNNRVQSVFSGYGPLWWSAAPHSSWRRNYPDLVANGSYLCMPEANGGDVYGSGTSYSSPQVAGAAALYRGKKTSATALETRTAILASLQDISAANPSSSVNGYGMGYLRTDKLVEVALGNGSIFKGALSSSTPSLKFKITTKAGARYAVALCWNRFNLGAFDYSDLDLEAKSGTLSMAKANTHVGNTNERLTFTSTMAANVDLIVSAAYLEPNISTIPFCLIVVEETYPFVPGKYKYFGAGCKGTGGIPVMSTNYLAHVGCNYTISLKGVSPTATAVAVLGFSDKIWGSINLPLSLGFFGAPGCDIYLSVDIPAAMINGLSTYTVPRIPELLGGYLYHQALIVDPGANAMGLTTSNALELMVGGSI